jgi:hypothetical protein
LGRAKAGAFAAAADDPDNPFGQEISMGISGAYQELGQAGFSYAGQYMDAVRQRFQATATSNDFIFVMTVGEGRKDNRLVRVNKENGMVMDYVSLGKDKDPVYEIDNIDNMIYYRIDTSVINGYKF